MTKDDNDIQESKPIETKLFYGIVYSVSVDVNASRFTVMIGEGDNSIQEEIDCPDIHPDNYTEIFKRGHLHAQKIIQSDDPRVLKLREC